MQLVSRDLKKIEIVFYRVSRKRKLGQIIFYTLCHKNSRLRIAVDQFALTISNNCGCDRGKIKRQYQ